MDTLIRQAQYKVLKAFSQEKSGFALSGGTALELYYLRHRFSFDLDFFSPQYNLKEIEKLALAFGKSSASFLKISRLVRDARVQKGFSQKEAALRAGMKQPDISRIEEGKKNITISTLVRICKILDIKTIEL